MNKYLSISKAAKELGVTAATIRRWERTGKLPAATRTVGNQRRYDLRQLSGYNHNLTKIATSKDKTIAYARVSSHDQKPDLLRQQEMLSLFCAAHGWEYEVISDLGSGMNYSKRGLRKLLQHIVQKDITRIVLTHKDRLLRFGAELVFSLCELNNIEVVLINKGSEPSFEEELAQDVLEIITVFSARLYGSRSKKNKKLLNELKTVVVNG
jgi:excisionase family DNA binding protein